MTGTAFDRNRARAIAIAAGTPLNHPDPENEACRIIGWRLPYSDEIGLGTALLGLDYIRACLPIADHARAMSEALLKVRPLGGSEMFSKVGEEYFADPVKCGEEIDRLRADLHEARKAEAMLCKRNAALLAYVEQMARMTTLDDDFEAEGEEGDELRARYDDVDEYHADLDDDRLMDEFSAFQDMIREARKLLA